MKKTRKLLNNLFRVLNKIRHQRTDSENSSECAQRSYETTIRNSHEYAFPFLKSHWSFIVEIKNFQQKAELDTVITTKENNKMA